MPTPQPEVSEILYGLGGRAPYVLARMALAKGDAENVINALGTLHEAHMAQTLDPPIPSVRARQVEDTLKSAATYGIDDVNLEAAQLLLATVIDLGHIRYHAKSLKKLGSLLAYDGISEDRWLTQ